MEKEKSFYSLCEKVSICTLCDRMKDSQRVLNPSVGNLNSVVMFIGEAPGRLGADATGIPFHGDRAGHNFEHLLDFADINREDIFITNAVLCNPKDDKGNNSTPNNLELKNCVPFLKQQIDIVKPQFIVTLGAKALQATNLIESHSISLKESVRTKNDWYGRVLIPFYHPGQRAMLHRSLANQRSDYQFLGEIIKRLDKKTYKVGNQKPSSEINIIIEYILKLKPSLSYFALHKLFYLIEYNSIKTTGQRLTNAYFVRQKDGPYCTDLHLKKVQNALSGLQIKHYKNGSIKITKSNLSLFQESLLNENEIGKEVIKIIEYVISKYGSLSMSELKKNVYLTAPMRNMLFLEKNEGINMYNAPLDLFQTSTNYTN